MFSTSLEYLAIIDSSKPFGCGLSTHRRSQLPLGRLFFFKPAGLDVHSSYPELASRFPLRISSGFDFVALNPRSNPVPCLVFHSLPSPHDPFGDFYMSIGGSIPS